MDVADERRSNLRWTPNIVSQIACLLVAFVIVNILSFSNNNRFVVHDIPMGDHVFELSALDMDGEFLENAEGEQVFAEINISPPEPKDPNAPRTARGTARRVPDTVADTPRNLRDGLGYCQVPSLFGNRTRSKVEDE